MWHLAGPMFGRFDGLRLWVGIFLTPPGDGPVGFGFEKRMFNEE